jgi:FkbM family methyltransferase
MEKPSRIDETQIVYDFLSRYRKEYKMMIDVGACRGQSCLKFVKSKWTVHAFEPNPSINFHIKAFLRRNKKYKNTLILNQNCVSDENKASLPFYLNDESVGICSLEPFHVKHKEAPFKVSTTRLDTYMQEKNINHVNYLKIDAEGYDFFILKGYDWEKDTPDVLECEYEDFKTKKSLGYVWTDMAEFLVDKGYHVVVSEWYPVVKYGLAHTWRCLKKYPCELSDESSWGNLLCFKDNDLYNQFLMDYKALFTDYNIDNAQDIITDKRVVIVGPAQYLEGMNKGDEIDKYDIVVRVNKGHNLTKEPNTFGSRTDILYHCASQAECDGGTVTEEMFQSIKELRLTFPELKHTDKTSYNKGISHKEYFKFISKLNNVRKKFFIATERELECRPNAGIMAICDILSNRKPKELYITGFTLFKGGYTKSYRTFKEKDGTIVRKTALHAIKEMTGASYKMRHNQYKTLCFIKKIIEQHSDIVKIDDELKEVLEFDLNQYKKAHALNKLSDEEVFNHYLVN